MKSKLALLLLAVCPLFGQAYRVSPSPAQTISTNSGSGILPQVLALPYANISIYTAPAALVYATTYSGASATTACANNAQVTLLNSPICQAYTDGQGNFGFWMLPGTYWYVVTSTTGKKFGPYPITVAPSSPSSVAAIYIVAGLPLPCVPGQIAAVSDAVAPTYNGVLVGGGSTYTLVSCISAFIWHSF